MAYVANRKLVSQAVLAFESARRDGKLAEKLAAVPIANLRVLNEAAMYFGAVPVWMDTQLEIERRQAAG